ncbi:MAG: hypothetical protein R6U13_11360 [Desulfatiglandaceae bacterium]
MPYPSLPTLDELCKSLQIPEINTGRVFNHLGFVYDNNEGLHAILDEKRFIRLDSAIEMPAEHVPHIQVKADWYY